MDELLAETMRFFLNRVVDKLNEEIDWRARGKGANPVTQAGLYLAAFARDLASIPLHNRRGIGQARFRSRIAYIQQEAVPVLRFFQENYPVSPAQKQLIDEAVTLLDQGCHLAVDGRLRLLDQWYATMKEFRAFTGYSRQAARKIQKLIQPDAPLAGGSRQVLSQ